MAIPPFEELLQKGEPFRHSPERDLLFFESMRESFLHHFEHNTLFKKLCYLDGFSSELFLQYEDIFYIPHFFAPVFLKRAAPGLPERGSYRTLPWDESGNPEKGNTPYLTRLLTGVFKDYCSLSQDMEANLLTISTWHGHHLPPTREPGDNPPAEPSIIDGYDEDIPSINPRLEYTVEALQRFAGEKQPVLIFGAPDALYEIRREFSRNNLPLARLGKRGFVFISNEGMGDSDYSLTHPELAEILTGWLDIPPDNIREVYSIPGHDIPYSRCEAGRMHIPVYSRVVARDPESLRQLPDGPVGLLHFYTPHTEQFPTISLLSTDLGITGKNCACGRNAPYMEPVRRKFPGSS